MKIPEGIQLSVDSNFIIVKGEKGEIKRHIFDPKINIKVENKMLKFVTRKMNKRSKAKIGTFKAHIKNMIKGTEKGHKYLLKVCSSHFPMKVTLSDNEISVQNLFGEKVPRKINLRKNVSVKLEGEIITVEGIEKELVSQTAADIENLTKRVNFDKRRFQDGIFIIDKDGKEIK